MGEVWLAEDTELPRKVAVKLLARHLAGDADAVERLLREARAAASVDHPAVVTVYEVGVVDGQPFLVMQRVEGETLERRLEQGPLSLPDAIATISRIADALAEVHALGIVHRDLKPANVILSPHGPKVLDFGVASVKGSPSLTTAGTTVGSPLTMSPELLVGRSPDNRADLWALGVMLYQAVTGRLPFNGPSIEAVMHSILNDTPLAPSAIRSGVPADLDFIVLKLLRKDPAHRYARAEELIADLESCSIDGRSTLSEPVREPGAGTALRKVAVIPFELMSTDPDDVYLASGLVEDLIVDLTRLPGVQVTNRAEVQAYVGRSVPPRTIARELGVDHVVLGSVRRAGTRARITTQLVRASDGHLQWADRFDRTLEDLFDVQAEVSKRIVEALEVALSPSDRDMLDRAPTADREAYRLYLDAHEKDLSRLRDQNLVAEDLLKEAIARDPDFALAHALLGRVYARRAMHWWAGLEVVEPALAHAQRALELQPELLEGLLALAMVHRMRGESQAMREVVARIVAIDPSHPEAGEWAAWSYMADGKPEIAAGILKNVLSRRPTHYSALSWLGQCYDMLGLAEERRRNLTEAIDAAVEELRRHSDNVHARSLLAGQLAQIGDVEGAIAQAERAIAIAPHDGRIRYNAACTYARLGKKEKAFAELLEGIRNVPNYIADWPRRDPDMALLHDDPEFIRLFGKAEPAR